MGAQHQLMFIAVLIVLISLLSGVIVLTATTEFKLFGESAWWAFLRLTDPDSAECLFDAPDYCGFFTYSLFSGLAAREA